MAKAGLLGWSKRPWISGIPLYFCASVRKHHRAVKRYEHWLGSVWLDSSFPLPVRPNAARRRKGRWADLFRRSRRNPIAPRRALIPRRFHYVDDNSGEQLNCTRGFLSTHRAALPPGVERAQRERDPGDPRPRRRL